MFDWEYYPDVIIKTPWSEPPFTRRFKMLWRPEGFFLHSRLGVDFFLKTELLYPNKKLRVRLIGARLEAYMISSTIYNILAIVECSLCVRRYALKDDYRHKSIDMLAYTSLDFKNLKNLAESSTILGRQNQFFQENTFSKAPFCRSATAITLNSAFTGSQKRKSLWGQRLDLRQISKLWGGLSVMDFDAADNFRLCFKTMNAMNVQEEIPLLQIDNFVDHCVLVFVLTWQMRESFTKFLCKGTVESDGTHTEALGL